MALKKIGYYISKGRCVKVYALKKKNRSGRLVTKKVNYRSKAIKKGTKVYKTKQSCLKALSKKMKRKTTKRNVKRRSPVRKTKRRSPVRKTKRRSPVRKTKRKSRFGECIYAVPYFGQRLPSVAKSISGTDKSGYSGIGWAWPGHSGAKATDMQQGSWYN